MPFLPLDLLKAGALDLGIGLSDEQLAKFDEFAALVVDANERFNLTRITEPTRIVTEHILDSLICLWAQEPLQSASVIDIGTGAGFPGIPMKIVRPDLHVTLVDGTFKKVNFLGEAIDKLGLEGIEAVNARAEEMGHDKRYREHYDIAVTRALANLSVAAELCLPLVRVGGRFLAAKSESISDEVQTARPIIGQLGGSVEKTVRTHIPGTDIPRAVVALLKMKPTPAHYPRPYARIVKKANT